MVRPKNETEDLLLLITENCETLFEKTHRNAEGTLKNRKTQPRGTFSFKPSISIEGSSMLRLTGWEVYNSINNITEENNKFELYEFSDWNIGVGI